MVSIVVTEAAQVNLVVASLGSPGSNGQKLHGSGSCLISDNMSALMMLAPLLARWQ